VSKLTVCECL